MSISNFYISPDGSLRELDTELMIAKEVSLTDKSLFIPVMNEVEEMRSYYGFNLK